jgi:hypothetical protein
MTLHVGIVFKVGFTIEVIYIIYGLYRNELEYGYYI